jgi:K+ transporter
LANFAKVAQGGYVPLILAALVYGVMLIWHLGANAVCFIGEIWQKVGLGVVVGAGWKSAIE